MRLYIAVDYALGVSVLERFEYLSRIEQRLPVRKGAFFVYIVFERDAGNEFHHEIFKVFFDRDGVDLDDIRMAEHGDRLRLVDEPFDGARVLGDVVFQ